MYAGDVGNGDSGDVEKGENNKTDNNGGSDGVAMGLSGVPATMMIKVRYSLTDELQNNSKCKNNGLAIFSGVLCFILPIIGIASGDSTDILYVLIGTISGLLVAAIVLKLFLTGKICAKEGDKSGETDWIRSYVNEQELHRMNTYDTQPQVTIVGDYQEWKQKSEK